MTSKNLSMVVVGAGGHAKVVVSTLQAAGIHVDAILDADESRWGDHLLDVPVTGPVESYGLSDSVAAVIAVGNNSDRRRLATTLRARWRPIVHPTAWIHTSVQIGPGTVVFAGCMVQPDVHIGAHAILNTGATVDHDSRVGDFTHIAPGVHLAGNVTVGDDCLVGIGSCVLPGITIGDGATVGAGAVVTEDVPPGVIVAGMPARERG